MPAKALKKHYKRIYKETILPYSPLKTIWDSLSCMHYHIVQLSYHYQFKEFIYK